MNVIVAINGKGNDVFIPISSIDRITIEPNTVWGKLNRPWYKRILGQLEGWVETGKYDILIETIGGNSNRIVFDTKSEALYKVNDFLKPDEQKSE